ncbi:uncharacterized protein BDZ83DRAFT_391973 [Colletotrichum acutatum]|uniref:Uncharacterized protein n=1 Tax=Glomerella acutata TaxID=27357 RepID=A0AAD8XH79_GLOAC|nr:uncharacterized protein BDZ83DRAFT_391973 [Colletotrichum acutatum]KAK1723255.1 hypothetical protein BDZ83DRAFT_391973 [Colletotrichum acutatum]
MEADETQTTGFAAHAPVSCPFIMTHPPYADTLAGAGADAVVVTGAVAGVAGVQSWHHTLAPTLARLARLSLRHLPWPWKAWSFYLSPPNLARHTQARLACPLTDGLSLVTVLPLHLWCNFAHLCPGTILPSAIHLLRPCHQCPVRPAVSLICKSFRQGGKGADNRYLAFIALPRGPHVADSLPRTKNLEILICVMRDILPRTHLVAVAEGPGPWIQAIMMNTPFYFRPYQFKAAFSLICFHDRQHGTHDMVRTP